MISKYYILKKFRVLQKTNRSGVSGAAEQERESAARRRGRAHSRTGGPQPLRAAPVQSKPLPLLSLLRKPGAGTGGGGGSRQHTLSCRERGHLALNSSLNPWPVPADTRPSAPWKGLECVRDSDCDTCFQLPGAVPEGRPGAWSGGCPGVRARVQGEKMLFQE